MISANTQTAAAENKSATSSTKEPEFYLPKVLGLRAAFLPQPSDATVLAAAILQDYKIEGEVPKQLKKDPQVQKAALAMFEALVDSPTNKYFEGFHAGRGSSNQVVAMSLEYRNQCVSSAMEFATKYGLTDYSRKQVTSLLVNSLVDSLDRMRPEAAFTITASSLKIAKLLGVQKEVLGNPQVQRAALGAMGSEINQGINAQTSDLNFMDAAERAAKLANRFKIDRFSKDAFLNLLGDHLAGTSQVTASYKHENLYKSYIYLAERLGLREEFAERKDFKKLTLRSIREEARSLVDSDLPERSEQSRQAILSIGSNLSLPKNEVLKILQDAHDNAAQRRVGERKTAVTRMIASIAESFGVKLLPA